MIPVVIPTMPERGEALTKTLSQLRRHAWADVRTSPHINSRLDVANAVSVAQGAPQPLSWWIYAEDDIDLSPRFDEIPHILCDVSEFWLDVGQVCFFQAKDKYRGIDGLHTESGKVYWSQCTAMRTCDALAFKTFADRWYVNHPEHHHASDLLLCAWTRHRGMRVMVHSPSLVQHRQLPSTLGSRSRHRLSESYIRAFGG